MKIQLTKKRLFSIAGILFIILISIFGYFYYKKVSPLETIASVPTGDLTNPPELKSYIFGGENNGFVMPLSVAVDSKEVFVSDSDLGYIQVFDYNGKFLRMIGDKKNAGKLSHPYGLAFNNNELYVADGGWGKIMIFDRQGNFKRNFEPKDGVKFAVPAQIVIKGDRLAFTDLALNKVFVFDLDGNLLLTFGKKGDLEGEFSKPHGLAIDSQGNFFVSDSNNNRVQKFNKDGKFIQVIGNGEILTPRSIAIDDSDRLYVVSGLGGSVHIFNAADGKAQLAFGGDTSTTINFSLPSGICVDGNRLYVTETMAYRVAVLEF